MLRKTELRKYFTILYQLILILLLINSCSDNETISTSKLMINSISPSSSYASADITIYGSGFGLQSGNSYVMIDTNYKFLASKCLAWNDSKITLTLPNISGNIPIRVVVGNDTSNTYYITVGQLPPIDMIEIPAGKFIMGSTQGLDNEKPTAEITISKSFLISKYEITQLQWKCITGNNSSTYIDITLPAQNITWLAAIEFCNTLSSISGYKKYYLIDTNNVKIDTSSNGYRLPTEAEWEYACRAGSTGDYSGDGILNDMGWYSNNSGMKPQPVGLKQANAFGLYDTHGNVWEWCWDWYDENYYSNRTSNIDPKGPDTGTRHVARGGSWADGNSLARSSNRTLNLNYETCGLRLVKNK